jgi:uracil-DNA glycosylase
LSDPTAYPDPHDELAELTSAAIALVQWYADTGAPGLPTETGADAVLASLSNMGAGHAAGSSGRTAARASAFTPAAPSFSAPDFAAPGFAARPAASAPSQSAPSAPGSITAAPRPANLPPQGTAPTATPLPTTAPAPTIPTTKPAAASTATRATEGSPASPEERRARLALLAEEARACTRCELHAQRKQAVFARGNPLAELCFVGEGPGADEDAQGEPFVGAAGQLLDKMIGAMGYRRDDVYICNIVKCRPPNNRKPELGEMAACAPFVTSQIALVKPKVIVALGATAVQGLLGTTEGITRLRGTWKLYKGTTPVMPTFHPAYLLRNPAAKRDVWSDLQEVMKHLGKAAPPKG